MQLDAVPRPLATPFTTGGFHQAVYESSHSRRQFPPSIYKRVQLKLQQIVAYWNLNCTDTESERTICASESERLDDMAMVWL